MPTGRGERAGTCRLPVAPGTDRVLGGPCGTAALQLRRDRAGRLRLASLCTAHVTCLSPSQAHSKDNDAAVRVFRDFTPTGAAGRGAHARPGASGTTRLTPFAHTPGIASWPDSRPSLRARCAAAISPDLIRGSKATSGVTAVPGEMTFQKRHVPRVQNDPSRGVGQRVPCPWSLC